MSKVQFCVRDPILSDIFSLESFFLIFYIVYITFHFVKFKFRLVIFNISLLWEHWFFIATDITTPLYCGEPSSLSLIYPALWWCNFIVCLTGPYCIPSWLTLLTESVHCLLLVNQLSSHQATSATVHAYACVHTHTLCTKNAK